MNWLDKLEKKYGHICIPHLISYLIAGQIVVYAAELFVNYRIPLYLELSRRDILSGQIWRFFSFIFVNSYGSSILSFIISAYFFWFIGSSLEKEWGDFRFNLYILCGMLGADAACLVTGYANADTLFVSLFLAFAVLYPNVQVLLFFLIPVRVKYLGWVAAGIWLWDFFLSSSRDKIGLLLCMAGFFAFFGPQLFRSLRARIRRELWKRQNRR